MQIRDGESDGPMRRALAGAVMAVLVVAACGGNNASATDNPPPLIGVATTTPPPTNTTIPPHQIDLSDGLPLTGTYAEIDVTVDALSIARIEPRTFLSDDPAPSEKTYAFLTLHISNTSDTDGAIISPSQLGVAANGEPQTTPVAVAGPDYLRLGVHGEGDSVLAFEVPADTRFEALALSLGRPGANATQLPLTGEIADAGDGALFLLPIDVSAIPAALGE